LGLRWWWRRIGRREGTAGGQPCGTLEEGRTFYTTFSFAVLLSVLFKGIGFRSRFRIRIGGRLNGEIGSIKVKGGESGIESLRKGPWIFEFVWRRG